MYTCSSIKNRWEKCRCRHGRTSKPFNDLCRSLRETWKPLHNRVRPERSMLWMLQCQSCQSLGHARPQRHHHKTYQHGHAEQHHGQDTAAADAIVRESGCMSYQLSNLKPLTYNKPDLHNPWFVVKNSFIQI